MKNFVKSIKKIFTGGQITRLLSYVGVIAIAVLISSCIAYSRGVSSGQKSDEPTLVDVRILKSQLIESSELTTAKLNLSCFAEFKDTGIKIINKSDFLMVYDATVRAGIDLEDVEIPEDKVDNIDKIIYITIPKAKLLGDPAVDPKTIKYYDEHFALFNVNEKEDANKAQALAQDRAKEQALKSGLIEMADKQSEALVVGLLSKIAPEGYRVEVLKEK